MTLSEFAAAIRGVNGEEMGTQTLGRDDLQAMIARFPDEVVSSEVASAIDE